MSDVFISYAHVDKERVRPFVDAFIAAGLSVWWDETILRGRWSDHIDDALKDTKMVVVFVTAASNKSYNVAAEAQTGLDQGKLIPVWLEKVALGYDLRGIFFKVHNYYFVDGFSSADDPNLQRLCRACGSQQVAFVPTENTEEDRVGHWLQSGPSTSDLALSLSISALETANYATVEAAAQLLQDILEPPVNNEHSASPVRRFAINLRSRRLGRVDAECFRTEHESFKKIEVERVRFIQPDRAKLLFDFVWHEVDGIQESLCKWLACLAEQPSAELRQYTGFAVGVLAQQHFLLVFYRLIEHLAFDDNPERRETADIALSVAVSDPHVREVALSILQGWANDASDKKARAVAEFSCGSTGSRFPDQVLPLLRQLIHRCKTTVEVGETVDIVAKSLRRRLEGAAQEEDSSLLDLHGLIHGFADWIDHPEDSADARAASVIFLCLAECLPVIAAGRSGPFSLAAVMEVDSMRDRFVAAFGAALSQSESYEAASLVVNHWVEKQAALRAPPVALGALCAALLVRASSVREKKRITYVFRRAEIWDNTADLAANDKAVIHDNHL